MLRNCDNCVNCTWKDGVTPFPDVCIQCKYVDVGGETQPSNWKPLPMTNGERIRLMSDVELAKWMAECNAFGERAEASQWLPWLQQPAEG